MAFSYSALSSSRKVTLPSVEGWNGNTDIIREPHRAVFTRQKTKIGDTSSFTQLIEDSGDRFSESISVFARGVNPSVTMQYNNTSGREAKLPHTLLNNGSFRPPIRLQQDLLPLSRLPHKSIGSSTSAPNFLFRSKNISRQDQKHFEQIQNHLNRSIDMKIDRPTPEPAPYISFNRLMNKNSPLDVFAHSSGINKNIDVSHMSTKIKPSLNSSVDANKKFNTKQIETAHRIMPIKTALVSEVNSIKTKSDNANHNDTQHRSVPVITRAKVDYGSAPSISREKDNSRTEIHLAPKLLLEPWERQDGWKNSLADIYTT